MLTSNMHAAGVDLKDLVSAPAQAGTTHSMYITKITFESDVPFTEDEFFYLTRLKTNSFITKRHLVYAYRQLMAKQRFTSVHVQEDEYQTGKHLHFILTGNWIFKKLQIHGVIFGKQDYATLYMLQPGEIFDATLHEQSLKSIIKTLHDQGYFDCTIDDELIYEKKRKTITTKLTLNRNKRYSFEHVHFTIADLNKHLSDEHNHDIASLGKTLDRKFGKYFRHGYYSNTRVKKYVRKMKDFIRKKNFLNPRITLHKNFGNKNKLDLTFEIALGKRKILTLEGNDAFSDQFIKQELLDPDQPDWLFLPEIITEQLAYEYYKKGYWHVNLSHEPVGKIGHHIIIDEQEPTIIEHIELIDAATHLPEKVELPFAQQLKNKIFDQDNLDHYLEKLQNYYLAHGYWDFTTIEKRFVKNHLTQTYTLKLLIDKGIQRFWAGFEIEPFKELEGCDFFKKYKLSKYNQLIPFHFGWLHEQRSFLLDYFHRQGYWYAEIQPELVQLPVQDFPINLPGATPPEQRKIFVRWHIKPGKQVCIGKVVVRGNTTIPFKHLRAQLKFKEGDLWNRQKLDLTRKRLKSLDVFKSIQLTPANLSKPTGKKTVLLNVVDDEPTELRFRVGYFLTSHNFQFKQQHTPKFGTSLIFKNPTNHADKLSFNVDLTFFEQRFNAEYQQPTPLGIDSMGRINAYANKYIHPVKIGGGDAAYEALQAGFGMSLSDQYKQHYHWSVIAGNEWIKTTRVRGQLNFDQRLIDKMLPHFYVAPSLIVDKLDDRFNTTSGTFSNASLKCMIPESSGIFTAKLIAEHAFFHPIYRHIIAAGRIKFGHIFRSKFTQVMPVERFYLGGPHSVRGYELDGLPPLGVQTCVKDGKTCKQYTIQGGSSMLNINGELRFPIYKSFGAVLFQDLGILSQTGLSGFGKKWFPSSGIGLRYKTPIGPLRFDLALKWKSRLEQKEERIGWHLTLGEAF